MLKRILVVLCLTIVATQAVIQNPGFLMRHSGHGDETEENVPVKFSVVPSQATPTDAGQAQQLPQSIDQSILINPAHIELSVPGVPRDVGDKIIQQIRGQMGQEPISLGELNNRLVHFTSEVPGTLINKTTVTEVEESTLVNKTVRMSPHSPMNHQQNYQLPQAPQNYHQQQQAPAQYVPQDYFYHPEPQVELKYPPQAPAHYQAPKQTYNLPQQPQQKQEYVAQPYQHKNPEPKVIYRYIEVCSNPQYRKAPAQKPYTTIKNNVQTYAPKNGPRVVVKTTGQSNGYSEIYSSQSGPQYSAQYSGKPAVTYQAPQNNYGDAQMAEKAAQDAAREYGRIQQEIAAKMAEVKRLQSIAEQKMQYQKQQMLQKPASYRAPKMTAEPVKVYDGNNVQISYHKEEENYKQ